MIKVEVIEKFTLKEFNKLKNVKRGLGNPDEKGKLNPKDTFECDEEMASYLTGNNPIRKVVVKVIEVEPKTINKNNVIEALDEALEKLEKEEITETLPVVNKNGVVVDKVIKEKTSKKKKSSKK